MFTSRRWWLLCGAVLVGVVALNGVVDAKAAPARGSVCVRVGAKATDGVSGRGLVCEQTRVRGLRWRFAPTAVTTTTTTTVPTTVPGVVAPVVVSASADDGVRVTVAGMRPDTGVYSLQWVPYGQSFNTYQMTRATSASMSVPAGWFACNRTYTFRVFVMQADWLLADGHQTQNVTSHSTPFDVVMPTCPTPATTTTTTTIAVTAPGAPTSITGTSGDAQVSLSWTAPSSNGGAAVTDYVVQYSTSASSGFETFSDGTSISTTAIVTGLTNGTSYYFKVAATNSVGTGDYSVASATVTPTAASCATGGVCEVGDTGPGGGIVFYVQASGTFACGATLTSTCKYLEAAPTSGTAAWTDAPHSWSGNTATLIGVTAQGVAIGTGIKNTEAMVTQAGGGDTASKAGTITRAYRGPNNLADWYLPSKDELNQMCKWQRGQAWVSDATICNNTGTLNSGPGAGGFSAGVYWSSSEYDEVVAWAQYFDFGDQIGDFKIGTFFVRPVRAFG
jgi:hypothetical protein